MAKKLVQCVLGILYFAHINAVGAVSLQQSEPDISAKTSPEASPLELVPDARIRQGKLENGLSYAVIKAERPVGQAHMQFYFNVGSLDEQENERGLAHFLEHMAFNGSTKLGEEDLVPLLQRQGLAFGADVNAYTSFDRTVYQLALPNLETETLDTSFLLMRELASELSLDAEAIDRERGVIESERRTRNNPGLRLSQEQLSYFFDGTKLPNRLPIGVTDVIETITAEEMRNFYHKYYRPENAHFVIAGDFDPEMMEKRIEQVFQDWTPVGEAGPERSIGTLSLPGGEIGSFFDEGVPLSVSYNGVEIKEKEEDSIAKRKTDLLKGLAIGAFNRRLALKASKQDAKFLNAATGFQKITDLLHVNIVSVFSDKEKWQTAFETVLLEWRKALAFGFEISEMEEILAVRKVSYQQAVDNQNKRQARALTNWLVASHAAQTIPTDPVFEKNLFDEVTKNLKPEDLLAAFRGMWQGVVPRFFIQGPEKPENLEENYKSTIQVAFSTPIEKEQAREAVVFAYDDFGPAGAVAEQRFDEKLGATLVRFKNNVRLTIKETDFQEETALLSFRFGTGISGITEATAGLENFLNPTLSGGGLGAHDAEDISRLLAGKTVSLGLQAEHEDFVFSNRLRPEDLPLQFQLLTALLVDPGFRPDGFSNFKRTINAVYDTLDKTPQGVLNLKGRQFLASGDARFGLPSLEKLNSYSLEDIRSLVQPSFAEGEIEIAVVGNVNTGNVIKAVAQTLATLDPRPLSDADKSIDWSIDFADEKEATFYHGGEENQSTLQLVWPSHGDDDPRQVAVGRLTRGILADLMRQQVREELGDAYSPSVTFTPSRFGANLPNFAVSLDLDPERINDLIPVVKKAASSIATPDGVTEDSLKRARKPITESFKIRPVQNRYWFLLLREAQSYPERILLAENELALYNDIKLEEIIDYAATWLKPDDAYILKALPAKGLSSKTEETAD